MTMGLSAGTMVALGVGAAAGGAIGGGLFSGSGGKGLGKDENLHLLGNQVKLSDMSVSAAKSLEDFYKNGTFQDQFTVGENYNGALGNYDMSSAEKQGSYNLNQLLQSGIPEMNQLGMSEYKDLLTTDKYNPMANKGTYFDPYMKQLKEQYGLASDDLDQSMALTGDFYSSNRANQQTDLARKSQQDTSVLLSNLYQDYMNKRLEGAKVAADMGNQMQQMELQKVAASQQYGALERTLADKQAKDSYNEWLRQRSEYGSLIDTAMKLYSGGQAGSTFNQLGAGASYTDPSVGDKLAMAGGNMLQGGIQGYMSGAAGTPTTNYAPANISGNGVTMANGQYQVAPLSYPRQ